MLLLFLNHTVLNCILMAKHIHSLDTLESCGGYKVTHASHRPIPQLYRE